VADGSVVGLETNKLQLKYSLLVGLLTSPVLVLTIPFSFISKYYSIIILQSAMFTHEVDLSVLVAPLGFSPICF